MGVGGLGLALRGKSNEHRYDFSLFDWGAGCDWPEGWDIYLVEGGATVHSHRLRGVSLAGVISLTVVSRHLNGSQRIKFRFQLKEATLQVV